MEGIKMKEKLASLEGIAKDIFDLTKKCVDVITQGTEDSKVVNQALLKLSTRINDMHLEIVNKEGS
jgi:hypothetical protein